jgi:hypothetical protein
MCKLHVGLRDESDHRREHQGGGNLGPRGAGAAKTCRKGTLFGGTGSSRGGDLLSLHVGKVTRRIPNVHVRAESAIRGGDHRDCAQCVHAFWGSQPGRPMG